MSRVVVRCRCSTHHTRCSRSTFQQQRRHHEGNKHHRRVNTPAIHQHAFTPGNTVGLKNRIWGSCATIVLSQIHDDGSWLINVSVSTVPGAVWASCTFCGVARWLWAELLKRHLCMNNRCPLSPTSHHYPRLWEDRTDQHHSQAVLTLPLMPRPSWK